MLTDGHFESMQRIAGFCVKRWRASSPFLSLDDMFNAALDAIVEEVAENGWPDNDTVLFSAGRASIKRANYEVIRHLRQARAQWGETPPGEDALAERVTDRVAAWQIAWALPDHLWPVVWATAEVMKKDGTQADAAALAGMSPGEFSWRLSAARKLCRALWVAPGETPPSRKYSAIRPDGRRTKAAEAVVTRRRQERKEAA
jgi:hypothetical protein